MKKMKALFENALLTKRQMQTQTLSGSADYVEEEPVSIGSTRLG
jgi:hypothetical protein